LTEFIQYTVIGLCTAGIFAIAASGLVVTYTTTGVFNFAHGAIGMLGAFTYWQFHNAWGWPEPLALAAVLLVVAPLFGVGLELGIMRRLVGTTDATQIVITISLLVAALGLGQWLWSPDESHTLTKFFGDNTVSIGGVNVTWHSVLALVVAVFVALALRLLLFGTRAGMTMRAAVDDRRLAMLNGARPDRSAMLSWALGCSLASLAGILAAPTQGLSHTTLTLLIVNAYAAAMIGRLRNLPLTFVGAVILGLADSYGFAYIDTSNRYLVGMRPAIPVLILFLVLIVLPQSRLRGHSAARSRERFPLPTWGGSLFACACVVGATAVVSTMLTDANALTLSKVFAIGIIGLSLVPLVGYAGQISLCQMSFAGIGAISMAHLAGHGQPIGLVWAAVICGAVGAVVALPALRLSGIYLALATAAFAVVLDRWIFLLPNFSLGPIDVKLFELGSIPVSRLRVPFVDPSSEKSFLVVLAVLFCVCALVVVWLRRSWLGERLLAMKDSPAACATLGLNLTMTKLVVFALSAGMAGVGGAVLGGSSGTVAADRFNLFQSLGVTLLAVVGGIGSAGGALFAGLVLYGIPIAAASVAWFANPARVLPGLMGIGLGKNPNGVVPDLATRFESLRRSRPVQVGLVAVLLVLLVAQKTELIDNWPYAILSVLAIFVAPGVADWVTADRVEVEPPLEWAGVDRPYSEEELHRIEEALR
jgi:branched-chain amino acid transport system permease protein